VGAVLTVPAVTLQGVIYFSFECEGPVGSVHGGAIATALDSVLGYYSMLYVAHLQEDHAPRATRHAPTNLT
jgi:hypothetical protein